MNNANNASTGFINPTTFRKYMLEYERTNPHNTLPENRQRRPRIVKSVCVYTSRPAQCMSDAGNIPVADNELPPVTLDSVKIQAAKVVGEIHMLYDLARELDNRDELPFDLYLVEDLRDSAEELSNVADGIE